MMDENKGGISFASNITYLPKKPSSGEPIQKNRTINGSILLSSGLNRESISKEGIIKSSFGEKTCGCNVLGSICKTSAIFY